jgi:predicted RNase H-like nuclease (RuvC/YqgF family)
MINQRVLAGGALTFAGAAWFWQRSVQMREEEREQRIASIRDASEQNAAKVQRMLAENKELRERLQAQEKQFQGLNQAMNSFQEQSERRIKAAESQVAETRLRLEESERNTVIELSRQRTEITEIPHRQHQTEKLLEQFESRLLQCSQPPRFSGAAESADGSSDETIVDDVRHQAQAQTQDQS